jgi:tRNA nucleotidyltransferase/poly(A) polymerase
VTPSNHNTRHAAERIVRELRHAGHTAYFAGGCVRDELLGLEPADYDIATDAVPERIRKLFARTAHVGAAFGVVLVTVGSRTIEVATFRADGPYSDRRRPDSVTFSDPESDAKRRDFTVNALFLDPEAKPTPADRTLGARGHVIDLVQGLDDLQTRTLRAVGNPEERLAEDHLRALRAVRFAARLGFTIEPSTAQAIRAHASDLVGVSRERIGDELRRILKHPSRSRGVELLSNLHLDSPVFNEPQHPGPYPILDSIPKTECPFPFALAALAADRLGPDLPVEAVVRRWRSALMLSNDERTALENTLTLAIKLRTDWASAPVSQRKRWASTPHFEWSLHLNSQSASLVNDIRADVQSLSQTQGGLNPEPLADGQILMDAGLIPGPAFGTILRTLYDLQLEGSITTKAQAIDKARELEADSGV